MKKSKSKNKKNTNNFSTNLTKICSKDKFIMIKQLVSKKGLKLEDYKNGNKMGTDFTNNQNNKELIKANYKSKCNSKNVET